MCVECVVHKTPDTSVQVGMHRYGLPMPINAGVYAASDYPIKVNNLGVPMEATGNKKLVTVKDVELLDESADDKLLREAGLTCSKDNLTGSGYDLLHSLVLRDYKAELVATVKQVQAARKDK